MKTFTACTANILNKYSLWQFSGLATSGCCIILVRRLTYSFINKRKILPQKKKKKHIPRLKIVCSCFLCKIFQARVLLDIRVRKIKIHLNTFNINIIFSNIYIRFSLECCLSKWS